jgi:hypothetical protein
MIPDMLVNNETKSIVILNPTTEAKYLGKGTRLGMVDRQYDTTTVSIKKIVNEAPKVLTRDYIRDNFIVDKGIKGEERKKLEDVLMEFEDIFSLDGKKLGVTQRVKCHIDVGDTQPIRDRPVPRAEKDHHEIAQHINKMLEMGVIEPSESPWAANCYLVPKKDDEGRWVAKRFITDFRSLNAVTKKMSIPLPRIEDVINRLNNAKYFSTLDLAAGFWQVEMDVCVKVPVQSHAIRLNKQPTHFRKINGYRSLWA